MDKQARPSLLEHVPRGEQTPNTACLGRADWTRGLCRRRRDAVGCGSLERSKVGKNDNNRVSLRKPGIAPLGTASLPSEFP